MVSGKKPSGKTLCENTMLASLLSWILEHDRFPMHYEQINGYTYYDYRKVFGSYKKAGIEIIRQLSWEGESCTSEG